MLNFLLVIIKSTRKISEKDLERKVRNLSAYGISRLVLSVGKFTS